MGISLMNSTRAVWEKLSFGCNLALAVIVGHLLTIHNQVALFGRSGE
jgi:hypothetical protein